MSRELTLRSLHHDLRGALSAVQMNLQTLDALEAGRVEATSERRRAIIGRALAALGEATELVDRLRPGPPDLK